jgi:pyruvate formate lyase activating enzyme
MTVTASVSLQVHLTDIQRFSVYDGPGIRTLFYFKGCPLRCGWCQNPETQNARPEILYTPEDCIGCMNCLRDCPREALRREGRSIVFDRGKCIHCGRCPRSCCAEARKQAGTPFSLDEAYAAAIADKAFYDASDGGVTLGGGEPTVNHEFVTELLRRLKEGGVHTDIETCGYCDRERFKIIGRNVDLFLFDIKHMDRKIHRHYTGADNALIHDNFRYCAGAGKRLVLRLPLIPGVNDGEKNLGAVANLAKECGIRDIHILPFHQAGESKWAALGKKYPFSGVPPASREAAERAKEILGASGAEINIGGSGMANGKRRDGKSGEGSS